MKDYVNDKKISVTVAYGDFCIYINGSEILRCNHKDHNGVKILYSLYFNRKGTPFAIEKLNEDDYEHIKQCTIKTLNLKNQSLMLISKDVYPEEHIQLLKNIGFDLIESFINDNTGNLLHLFSLNIK